MAVELDIYDDYRPKAMTAYLRHFGWHFSKKACEEAVSNMRKLNHATGKKERIEPMTKEKVEELLAKYNIKLEHNHGYDAIFIANMGIADFYMSSIPDEHHLALYVKDVIDDPDLEGGNAFRRWYSDQIAKGEPIEWEDLLD